MGESPIPALIAVEPAIEPGKAVLLSYRPITVPAGIGKPAETIDGADALEIGLHLIPRNIVPLLLVTQALSIAPPVSTRSQHTRQALLIFPIAVDSSDGQAFIQQIAAVI